MRKITFLLIGYLMSTLWFHGFPRLAWWQYLLCLYLSGSIVASIATFKSALAQVRGMDAWERQLASQQPLLSALSMTLFYLVMSFFTGAFWFVMPGTVFGVARMSVDQIMEMQLDVTMRRRSRGRK